MLEISTTEKFQLFLASKSYTANKKNSRYFLVIYCYKSAIFKVWLKCFNM
ncbi:hypothetical protein Sbal625DRAFT_4118 [Shewanella baltica OS625]|nr:hypothetical protein Sbal625DRAFT_4118 [Shewanella baltica OS625]